ncbi:unnamed protein product, partial [Laminaria digitata]
FPTIAFRRAAVQVSLCPVPSGIFGTKGFRVSTRHYYHGVTHSSVFLIIFSFQSLKPPLPLYLRAFEALFHPRTDKNVISLNLVPYKRKATKKLNMKLSKKKKKKAPKFVRLCSPAAKTDPIIFFAFGEIPPTHILANAPKKVRGPKTDVRNAVHLLSFVVRCADFSEKWCNCATFHHLFITLIRTQDRHKNLHIPRFLLRIFGPDDHLPPKYIKPYLYHNHTTTVVYTIKDG